MPRHKINARPKHKGFTSYTPDDQSRRTVELMTFKGDKQSEICAVLDIDQKTLRKFYRAEIDLGRLKMGNMIVGRMAQKINQPPDKFDSTSMAAAKLVTYHLLNWKERVELTGKDGAPIEMRRTPDDVDRSIEGKLAVIAAALGKADVPPKSDP